MSIATDVSRIKGNITAALAAIADKGVTVPDGSTSDALAELITNIEAGGGGGDISPFMQIGTYIPSEDQNETVFEINNPDRTFNVDCINKSIFLLWKNETGIANGSYIVMFCNGTSTGSSYSYGVRPSGSIYNTNQSSIMHVNLTRVNWDRMNVTITGNTTANFTYGLVAGVEYGWGFIYKG